jgi:hypothetical protein
LKHTSIQAATRIVIHAGALLAAAFLSLSAAAQAKAHGVRISDNWAAPGAAATVERPAPTVDKLDPQVRKTPAVFALKDIAPSPARTWNDHMAVRQNAEDFNCLLSFGVGGELKAGGYAGTRLFGRTLTLNGGNSK